MTPVLPFRHDSDILDRIRRQGGRTSEEIQYLQFVTVTLGGTKFAVDAVAVAEVMISPPLIAVGANAPLLVGVVNVRGNIIPVFDPRSRLGVAAKPEKAAGEDDEERLLVFRASEGLMALYVDDVTLRLADGRVPMRPPEGVTITPGCARIAEISDGLLPMLEIDVLLNADERKALADVKNSF